MNGADIAQFLVSGMNAGDPESVYPLNDLIEEGQMKPLLEVGRCYLVETLTNYYTGLVTECDAVRTVLKDPAWIPDTGRLSAALKTGKFQEVERGPDGESRVINTSHISGAWVWDHPLPRETK